MNGWTGLLGLMLIVAPFALGYAKDQAALWSNLVLGAAALVVSLWIASEWQSNSDEYWCLVVIGFAAIVAPWALGFGADPTAAWATVVLGLVLSCLSGYEAVRRSQGGPADRGTQL